MKITLNKSIDYDEAEDGSIYFWDITVIPELDAEKEELIRSNHTELFIDQDGNLRIFLSE